MYIQVLLRSYRPALLMALMQPFMASGQTLVCTSECPWEPLATQVGGLAFNTTVTTWPGTGAMVWSVFGGPRFRNFQVIGGRIYEWSMCDADGGDHNGDVMTILDPATNATLCHWRYAGACGEATIRYQAPANGQVRIYVNGAACDGEMTGGTIVWRCLGCGDNGCTNAANGESPAGTFVPACTGIPEVITSLAPDATYSSVQLTAGTTYTFSALPLLVLYPNPSWITITDATGTIIYTHAQRTRNFTPPSTGTYRFYTSVSMVDFGCATYPGDLRAIRCGTYDPCVTTPITCEVEELVYLQGTGSWPSGPCGAAAGIERIYSYTPAVSGVYRMDITDGLYPSPGIRYAWKEATLGCDANNWNCLGTITGAVGQFTLNLTAGVPIHILADAVDANAIWQKIALRCAIPQNQTCATAAPVDTYPATLTANARWTSGSSSLPCLSNGTRVLWYKATGLCGTVTANTCGSDANTTLAVYSGTCASLTEVACNDNATTGPCSGTQQSSVSWAATEGTEYFIAVANPPLGFQSSIVLNITEPDSDGDGIGDACEVRPNVRVMLDGPYDSSTGLMKDGIRTLGQLQLIEPYTNMNYPHVNGGGESTTLPVVSVGGNNAIVDWVVIELRSATTPTLVVDTRSALLQRDGDIVDVDGVSPVNMRSPSGNYHVAIRHRNHLAVMTSTPVALSPISALLDFTNVVTGTYGIQALKTSGGAFSKQVMWCGDVDSNGTIKYTGEVNDRDPVLMMIGGVIPTNTVITYSFSDLNMDGVVKYTGEDNDRDRVLSTIGGTVPTNTRVQQLP